jgi:hypothetical protein
MQCGRAVFRARFCIHCEYRSGTRESKSAVRDAPLGCGATSHGVCQGFADSTTTSSRLQTWARSDERDLRMGESTPVFLPDVRDVSAPPMQA